MACVYRIAIQMLEIPVHGAGFKQQAAEYRVHGQPVRQHTAATRHQSTKS